MDEGYDPPILRATELVPESMEKSPIVLSHFFGSRRNFHLQRCTSIKFLNTEISVLATICSKRQMNEIAELLRNLLLNATAGSSISEELSSVERDYMELWVEVKEYGEVRKALVNNVLERLEEVCDTKSEISSNEDYLQGISGSEDKTQLKKYRFLLMCRNHLKNWRILFSELGF